MKWGKLSSLYGCLKVYPQINERLTYFIFPINYSLGKTMQSISILVYMMQFKGDNGPHLIIVPKSTLSNWMNELARWGKLFDLIRNSMSLLSQV